MSYRDTILQKVTKPARYIGGEWNSIVKDWGKTEVKVALSYPDLYEVGMSNLALPILYELLNQHPQVLCERVFAPWSDMEEEMRRQGIPLCSLESHHPLKGFDIIGFSLGYELTYTNVLNILDLAQIPVCSSQRDDSYPLIIAGGVCALNPEPMSDFIDLFVIGEGEEVTQELVELFRDWKKNAAKKDELLRGAADIPGIYVPSLYHTSYHPDGTVASFNPLVPGINTTIQRRVLEKLPPPVTKPVVPYVEVIHDRAAVEIQRGCTRGCRFCQAGMVYRPLRWHSPEDLSDAVDRLIKNCGYNEVSLVSLNSGDYPQIESLVETLTQQHQQDHLTLSLPSLRLDSVSKELMDSLRRYKKPDLTFAPEAGSERLRQVINKNLPEDKIMSTLTDAFARGWTNIKLYFMVGLPTETNGDVTSIVELARRIQQQAKKTSGRQPRIKISLSAFVPKAHTPFQWVAQDTVEQLNSKYGMLYPQLRKLGMKTSWPDPNASLLEAVLARGSRRLGKVIYHAWRLGCTFDAWSERFSYDKWAQAFEACQLTPDFYAHREHPLDEALPWAHIDVGVSQEFLKREYHRALAVEETSDCRYGPCNACGFQRWLPDCKKRYDQSLR